MIGWNTLRVTFALWRDRAIAVVMLLGALAVARSWFADQSWTVAAWVAFAAAAMTGLGTGRLVMTRLAFHVSDGLFAADALHPPTRRRYMAAWHCVGMALLILATLTARPSLLVVSVPAYLGGALLAGLTNSFRISKRVTGTPRPGWTIRAWLHRPIAGVIAAVILFLSVLPARGLDTDAPTVGVGIEAILLTLALTMVDDSAVRFMTIVGHGSSHIIVLHSRSMASFLAVAMPGCCLIVGPAAAGVVVAACVATLLLLTLRTLAYRQHGKRLADLLVSLFAALLMFVAFFMPMAFPVVAFAMLWQLQRKGRANTWLLA